MSVFSSGDLAQNNPGTARSPRYRQSGPDFKRSRKNELAVDHPFQVRAGETPAQARRGALATRHPALPHVGIERWTLSVGRWTFAW